MANGNDIEKALQDFVATVEAKPDLTDGDLMGKFPEFNNDATLLQAARDYYATSKSGKYKTAEELNSKFPEFFGDEVSVKKKDEAGVPVSPSVGEEQPSAGPSPSIGPEQLPPAPTPIVGEPSGPSPEPTPPTPLTGPPVTPEPEPMAEEFAGIVTDTGVAEETFDFTPLQKEYQRKHTAIKDIGNRLEEIDQEKRQWSGLESAARLGQTETVTEEQAQERLKLLDQEEKELRDRRFKELDTGQGRGSDALSRYTKALIGSVGDISKAIAIYSKDSDWFDEYTDMEVQDLWTYKVGQWMQDTAEELFPTNPAYQEEFISKLSEGGGTLTAYALGGAGARAVKLSTAGTAAVMGAAQNATGEYEQAMELTGDEDKAMEAYYRGFATGSIEGLPVGRFFKRLDTVSGGGVKKALASGFKGGVEEMTQEVVSQTINNYNAQQIYDFQRDLWDGTTDGGTVGFALGFLMNALGVGLKRRRRELAAEGKLTEADKALLDEAEQEIEGHAREAHENTDQYFTPEKGYGKDLQKRKDDIMKDLATKDLPTETIKALESEMASIDEQIEQERQEVRDQDAKEAVTDRVAEKRAGLEEQAAREDISDASKEAIAKQIAALDEMKVEEATEEAPVEEVTEQAPEAEVTETVTEPEVTQEPEAEVVTEPEAVTEAPTEEALVETPEAAAEPEVTPEVTEEAPVEEAPEVEKMTTEEVESDMQALTEGTKSVKEVPDVKAKINQLEKEGTINVDKADQMLNRLDKIEADRQAKISGIKKKRVSQKKADELVAKLDKLKIGKDRLYSLPPGANIVPAVWNGSIEAAKVAVKAGATVAEAVEIAIEHIRKNTEGGIDDKTAQMVRDQLTGKVPPAGPGAETKAKPEGAKERSFAKRVQESTDIPKEVKDLMKEVFYVPKSNLETTNEAKDYIKKVGAKQAYEDVVTSKSIRISPGTRVIVGREVIDSLVNEGNKLKEEGDIKGANEKYEEAANAADHIAEMGTRMGQAIQAFSLFDLMSAESFLRYVRKQLSKNKDFKDDTGRVKIPENILTEALERWQKAKNKPEGFQRDMEMARLLGFIRKKQGISAWDIATAVWYGGILSGYTTQVLNAASTFANTLSEGWTQLVTRPKDFPKAMQYMFLGMGKGALEFGSTLNTGISRTGDKLDTPDTLELVTFKGGKWNPLNYYKYVGRFMKATDAFFYHSAKEMKSYMLAVDLAKSKGLKGKELSTEVMDILHNTRQAKSAAAKQAKAEGLTGRAAKRRQLEILQQNRPEDFDVPASRFAQQATFNHDPEGALGIFANAIASVTSQVGIAKIIVPFTRIVANVSNRALDYTPLGYKRAWTGFTGEQGLSAEKRKQRFVKATLGTIGMVAAASIGDDEDNYYGITGSGPSNWDKHKQLLASGWKPHSIRIGDTYYEYKNSPLAIALTIGANVAESDKFNESQEDTKERMIASVMMSSRVIMDQSFMKGLSDLFVAMSRGEQGATSAKRIIGRYAGSWVPNLAKQVDRIWDPTIYETDDLKEIILQSIPVVREMEGKPRRNVLGEKIIGERFRFIGERKSDPVWRWLTKEQVFISIPNEATNIIDNGDTRHMTEDEYYRYTFKSGAKIKKFLSEFISSGQDKEFENKEEMKDYVKNNVNAIRGDVRSDMEYSMLK